MRSLSIHKLLLISLPAIALVALPLSPNWAEAAEGKGKVKVLYHVDGKDPEVAKYALALINKHIEAEGGPENIDVELVVHGPALELFDKEDRKSTRLNSSHGYISYAVFCLKKKKKNRNHSKWTVNERKVIQRAPSRTPHIPTRS